MHDVGDRVIDAVRVAGLRIPGPLCALVMMEEVVNLSGILENRPNSSSASFTTALANSSLVLVPRSMPNLRATLLSLSASLIEYALALPSRTLTRRLCDVPSVAGVGRGPARDVANQVPGHDGVVPGTAYALVRLAPERVDAARPL